MLTRHLRLADKTTCKVSIGPLGFCKVCLIAFGHLEFQNIMAMRIIFSIGARPLKSRGIIISTHDSKTRHEAYKKRLNIFSQRKHFLTIFSGTVSEDWIVANKFSHTRWSLHLPWNEELFQVVLKQRRHLELQESKMRETSRTLQKRQELEWW